MTADLLVFLRARLDDDERVAKRAEPNQAPNQLRAMVTRDDSAPFLVIDSGRVLTEVEAKRRILDWLDEVDRFMERDDMSWHRLAGEADTDNARRLLALTYSDDPAYRPEWRPEGAIEA